MEEAIRHTDPASVDHRERSGSAPNDHRLANIEVAREREVLAVSRRQVDHVGARHDQDVVDLGRQAAGAGVDGDVCVGSAQGLAKGTGAVGVPVDREVVHEVRDADDGMRRAGNCDYGRRQGESSFQGHG